MRLNIKKAGMLTSVQDLGRWGFQSSGVPVAGAMDLPALRLGNTMLGNPEGAAALEVTLLGPEIEVKGEGAVVFAGADLGFAVNGNYVAPWTVRVLKDGDIISFTGPRGSGCRGNLCFAGGIDLKPVMNSRSTYMRAHIGGLEGRALKAGDTLETGDPAPLLKRLDGFTLPPALTAAKGPDEPLAVTEGLQSDAFTEKGLSTLYTSEYSVTAESDRMGCRLDGEKIEHNEKGADIVSDAIPLGAVQVPGHGMPIVMLADRQTTGGYTKVGVLTPLSVEALVQKLPGSKVLFRKAEPGEGVRELKELKEKLAQARELRFAKISRQEQAAPKPEKPLSGSFRLTVNGKSYEITCQELESKE